MICKECGAYNPDHATFCKVCAASLKEDTAPKPVEEEPQPTKRFSRPSWMAAEHAEPVKQDVKETSDAIEEAAEAEEPVANPVEPEDVPVHEEEETPVPIWSPSRSRMIPEPNDTDEEEEEDAQEPEEEESDEEPDSIYNDEEALEEDDGAFEYEPTPPKRKQNKKKNNTMFTVLLIAIIVVIVGILVLGGYMLLKNQLNCGKSPEKSGDAEQTSTQTGEQPSTPVEPETTEEPALDAKNAQLQEMIDENGNELLVINYVLPAHSTIEIYFPHQDNFTYTNDSDKDIRRGVKVSPAVYYPNRPLEPGESTMEFQPEITIHNADGSSYPVNCPSYTRSFPTLEVTVTEPIPEGDEPYMAPESNVVSIEGIVNDPGAEVTVNGVITTIYVGNKFMYDYKFADTATEDTVETVTISATKNNCVSDTKEVKIHAYKFIPEPMKLEVRSEGSALRADKSGKLTVTGTTLPGATLKAASDNATNVLCGSVAVDAEGNFSFQITTDPSFYGMSVITLNAEKEGAESGSTKFTITKGFADKDAFLKFYNSKHNYLEIPKKITIDVLLANQTQYASNDYGFRLTAAVVEVITIDGDTIVKMSLNKTNETVYVHNLSDKWQPGENVGAKYNVYGNFIGTYSDTGCAEFYGWFAKKP